jgi:hypothetical protein
VTKRAQLLLEIRAAAWQGKPIEGDLLRRVLECRGLSMQSATTTWRESREKAVRA